MYEEEFPIRLAQLRTKKGVSARDMSLSIGQNAGYINNIECGKALPSMAASTVYTMRISGFFRASTDRRTIFTRRTLELDTFSARAAS